MGRAFTDGMKPQFPDTSRVPGVMYPRQAIYPPNTHDDSTTNRPNEPGEVIDHDETDTDKMNITLTPAEVAAWAGLGEDEDVSDRRDEGKTDLNDERRPGRRRRKPRRRSQ